MVKDSEFLFWVHERLVFVHGEDRNVDFLIRLRKIAKEAGERELAEAMKRAEGLDG